MCSVKYKTRNCSDAEHARQRALSDLEAYRESIKTKEELIMRLTEPGHAEQALDYADDDQLGSSRFLLVFNW